ncbi:MAG: biotin--[acetyl-CoA-carboxylase] ligase [Longimicrobiales bacterium]
MSASTLLHAWEGRPVDEWRARWGLPALAIFRETASTNDVARAMAEAAAAAGLLVMSEHQSAGRGRMRRPWTDVPGRSLLLSFLLRPRAGSADVAPGAAPIRVGLAVAGALRTATGIDARLKWPNDVVVTDAGKLAGILCEAASVGGETVVIAGIGINVLHQPDDWPDELRGHAVSVAQLADGAAADRARIMDALIPALRPLFTRPLEPLGDDELRAYHALDALRGRVATISGATQVQGTAAGIAADGALLLDVDGHVRRITAGSVRVTASHTLPSARAQR